MKKRKGFTLTEVLAGLVILAILSGVLTTCFLAASRTMKRASVDRAAINAAANELEAEGQSAEFSHDRDDWPMSYSLDGTERYVMAGTETVTAEADNPRGVGLTLLTGEGGA